MQSWLIQNEIEQRGIVSLYNEKENLLERDIEEGRANDYIRWIGPNASPDQV